MFSKPNRKCDLYRWACRRTTSAARVCDLRWSTLCELQGLMSFLTALRRISSWMPVLQRSCTRSCQVGARATCRLLHTPDHAHAVNTCQRQRGATSLQTRAFGLSAFRPKSTDDLGSSNGFHEEGEDEDFLEDSEVEELFQQQIPAGIGEEQHRVFIVHPDVKWGSRKQHLTTGNSTHMLRWARWKK